MSKYNQEDLNRAKDYSANPMARGVMNLLHRVNSVVKDIHGQGFDLTPREGVFEAVGVSRKNAGKTMLVRQNSAMPSAEIFALVQEFVRAADEPFAAEKIYETDSGFYPGAKTIGFDVVQEQGEARLVGIGRGMPTVAKSDVEIGRSLQHVGKLMAEIEVTRDDLQTEDVRNSVGIAPKLDWLAEKTRIARKNIARAKDQIIMNGGIIEGVADGRIQSLSAYFSTNAAIYNAASPTKGAQLAAASGTWFTANRDQILADLRRMQQQLTQLGTYVGNTLVLPHSVLTHLAMSPLLDTGTSNVYTMPFTTWLKSVFKESWGIDLKIVGSNAMQAGTLSGSTRGNTWLADSAAMLIDSQKQYQAIAVVEPLTMLQPVVEKDGTIRQVMQEKTGGLIVKHPGSQVLLTGVQHGIINS